MMLRPGAWRRMGLITQRGCGRASAIHRSSACDGTEGRVSGMIRWDLTPGVHRPSSLSGPRSDLRVPAIAGPDLPAPHRPRSSRD